MTYAELMVIPYASFVNGLFIKPEDQIGKLVHAAIGMAGEAVELQFATGRQNEIEELGDFEFYYQAFYLHAPATQEMMKSGSLIAPRADSAAVDQLVWSSYEILDQMKKHWIYSRPWESLQLLQPLMMCRASLEVIYKLRGFTQDQVLVANREKLIKRYPGAEYTDAAAQARADKAPL